MKVKAISTFLLFAIVSFGQNHQLPNDVAKFRLTISTYNNAEKIFNGTTTYVLTESSIKVVKTSELDTISDTIYTKAISKSKNISSIIEKIRIDSLKDFYSNNCVMITSGDEYFIEYTTASENKNITIHHYYLKEVEDIVKIINENLPSKYMIHYLTKDTKQDCNSY